MKVLGSDGLRQEALNILDRVSCLKKRRGLEDVPADYSNIPSVLEHLCSKLDGDRKMVADAGICFSGPGECNTRRVECEVKH